LKLLQEHIIQDEGPQLEFEKNGCYSLAAQDNEFTELKKVAEVMRGLSIPTETYGTDDILKRVGARNFVGGIKYLDDATINPVKLVNKIRSQVKADLFEQTEAIRIESTSDGMRVLKTDRGDFEAAMVLMNLNGYTATLHPWFKDKIYPTRGQCLMVDKVPRFMEGPCYANFYLDYFRQIPSGELLIGGFRQVEKETEVGISDHITDPIQNSLHHFVQTHLPQFNEARVTHRWSGVMGFSADGQPMVGSLPDDPQVFFAGGYTGHGIGLAFHTAKQLVEMVFGGDVPRWLSARRFS
jgi:glycine/D-amino acid oxidase-like deaminating enzyme